LLELAAVGSADHLNDLGARDGRIVILAARRFGATEPGVEIVDDLVRRSRASAARAGVADRVEFRTEDLFTTDLLRVTVVTIYLLPKVNLRLLALSPGGVVSHDYDLGDLTPDRTIVVDVRGKPVGREARNRPHLWIVPAQLGGLWCGAAVPAVALRLRQRYQQVQAEVDGAARRDRVDGRRLMLHGPDGRAAVLQQAANGFLTVEPSTAGWPTPRRPALAGAERCPARAR
jgi:hypothetical protein